MTVEDVMTRNVQTCGPQDPLSKAASIMWEHDCGCVPVVDRRSRVVGMVTDRDICMSTWMQGKPSHRLSVNAPMSRTVWSCAPGDTLEAAEKLMRDKKVRRLPVVDAEDRLVGILSLNDIVREAVPPKRGGAPRVTDAEVCKTLAGVSKPRRV